MPPCDQLQVKMEEEHDETHESDASVRGERQKLRKVRQNSRARERYLMFGSICAIAGENRPSGAKTQK